MGKWQKEMYEIKISLVVNAFMNDGLGKIFYIVFNYIYIFAIVAVY